MNNEQISSLGMPRAYSAHTVSTENLVVSDTGQVPVLMNE